MRRYITKGVVVKIFILLIFFLSFTTQACIFSPEGLIEDHNRQFNYLILTSLFIALVSLSIRFFHQKSRLWVPTILILVFGSFSFVLFNLEVSGVIRGSGVCGRTGLILIGQICLGGYLAILFYETLKYIKHMRNL